MDTVAARRPYGAPVPEATCPQCGLVFRLSYGQRRRRRLGHRTFCGRGCQVVFLARAGRRLAELRNNGSERR